MKNSPTLNYQSYYNEIFSTDQEREQQQKVKFLNFVSEMILKYSDIIQEKNISLEEE